MNSEYFIDKDYYKDFYFIYVVTGTNYIRPIIKSFDFVPKGTNVVILTNTPDILKDIKVNFNLIVDDLEKYRTDWSRENEPVINIQDEQSYMDEYRKKYQEETYRYPMAIMRFGMNWAIQNNVKKLLLVDVGCKIGFDLPDVIDGFERLEKIGKERNLILGYTWDSNIIDNFALHLQSQTFLSDTLKKYIPNYNSATYPKEVNIYDPSKNLEYKKIGSVGFDGFCYGFWFHDIDLLKIAYNFWCELVEKSYEANFVERNKETDVIVAFEFQLSHIADLLTKYYNVLISHYLGIIRHFYHPENDFIDTYKMRHLDLLPAKTRQEFIDINREKIISVNGEYISKLIIDGLEDEK